MTDTIARVFQAPETSFFLLGARGTGKSTLMRAHFPDALYIDLLLSNIRRQYTAHPELIVEKVRLLPKGKTIIIDEVQKIPALLPNVHALIEEKKGWQFILLGSSARKLKMQGVDLLAGRAIKKTMHPFMACELGNKFSLTESLQHGMLPLRFGLADVEETLQTYISLYLEEEIKHEGLIRNIEPFARFLEAISFSHASLLNVTNVARDCMVKRTTVQSWVSILEDMLICYQIPIFSKRAKRELIAHSKFYLFDVGIYRALRPYGIGDAASELNGAALEGLVAQHLYAWKEYTKAKHDLYFWRTRAGVEVDFIVHGPLGLWAIEVKNSDRIKPEDLRPLQYFLEDYPEAQAIMLYRGQDRLLKDNIYCLPCEEFLSQMVPNKELTDFLS